MAKHKMVIALVVLTGIAVMSSLRMEDSGKGTGKGEGKVIESPRVKVGEQQPKENTNRQEPIAQLSAAPTASAPLPAGAAEVGQPRSGAKEDPAMPTAAYWQSLRIDDPVAIQKEGVVVGSGTVRSRTGSAEGGWMIGVAMEDGGILGIKILGEVWEGRWIHPSKRLVRLLAGDSRGWKMREADITDVMCAEPDPQDPSRYLAGLPTAADAAPEDSGPGGATEGKTPEDAATSFHSNPGATGVLYLDFDGETVSGTYWNTLKTGGAAIVAASSGFSDAQIETAWRVISEDYRAFNIDVTTDRSTFEATPIQRRQMVIFTTSNEWYGATGGTSFKNEFPLTTSDDPAWVFTDQLLSGGVPYAPWAGEAGAHEAGHTFGLSHDGLTDGSAYYEGNGTGATSWAPIMGASYYCTVTTWSKGEYTNANNTEDDIAIISGATNGLGFRADDVGDSIGTSTPVTVLTGSGVEASGVISTRADVDVFRFDTVGGTVSFTASNEPTAPDLDIKLQILNSSGTVVATADSSTTLDATISTSLAAGTFYLTVEGVGTGTVALGYSDYASEGLYTITGTVPPVPVPATAITSPAAPGVSLPFGSGLMLAGTATMGTPLWTVVSAPAGATATFSDTGALQTRCSFSATGSYTLRLEAGGVSDDLTVSVEAAGANKVYANRGPAVDAGGDRGLYDIHLVFAPTVTDDGVPAPAALTCQWTMVSGPASLTNATQAAAQLDFTAAGAALVRLAVSDGEITTFSEVTVTAFFHSETFLTQGASARHKVPSGSGEDSTWKATSFNDSAWTNGTTGFGYDANTSPQLTSLIGTNVQSSLYNKQCGCYSRLAFTLADASRVKALTLRMKYDDAFVAYLNGTEVARSATAPSGTPSYSTKASSNRATASALVFEDYPVTITAGLLNTGTNVLAVHGMNYTKTTSDKEFLILPELVGLVADTTTPATVTLSGLAQTYTGSPCPVGCTTNPAGLSVAVTYNGSPTVPVDAGSYAVAATVSASGYSGSASGTLVVGKATGGVLLGSLTQTYNGSPRVAAVTTIPAGLPVSLTYNGSATAPTNAGSYAVAASIVSTNYSGSANSTLQVARAQATILLSDLEATSDGEPKPVTVATVPAGLPCTVTYDGSTTPPTESGEYAVAATVDTTNYCGSASGTLVLSGAEASITLDGFDVTYDGEPKEITVVTDPPDLPVTVTYNGSTTPPTDAGTYEVVATVTGGGYGGSETGTLVISRAPASILLIGLSPTYDGSPKAAVPYTSPEGLPVRITYDGSETPPTNAGSYTVVAAVTDPNHTGLTEGAMTIAPGEALILLENLAQSCDGNPKIVAVRTVPPGLPCTVTYDGSTTPPAEPGEYAVAATVDTTNYRGSASGTLVLSGTEASITLDGFDVTYDGEPKEITVATDPPDLPVTVTYNGSTTPPTDAGTYEVVATVAGGGYSGSGTGTLVISRANASILLVGLAPTFDGSPKAAAPYTSPEGLAVQITYDGSAIPPTNAGSYTVVATVTDPNYAGLTEGAMTIARAEASVLLGGLAQSYDGNPKCVTVATTPADLPVAVTYNGSTVQPIATGSYAVIATVSSPNYTGSACGTLMIEESASPYDETVKTLADPACRRPDADPDGDGICNLMEHATGTRPDQKNCQPPNRMDAGTRSFQVHVPAEAPADVRYIVQRCTALGGAWTTVAEKVGEAAWTGTQPSGTDSDGSGGCWVRFPACTTNNCGFFRLKVELAGP